jgi:5-methylcytosine-specific restriction endonuclease McrA
MAQNPSKIHNDIAAIIRANPRGMWSGEVRRELRSLGYDAGDQAHADRRMRDLKQWWHVRKRRDGKVVRYMIGEMREKPHVRGVSLADRAIVLRRGKCAMCGWTVAEDGIKLVVDHKVPHDWGGTDDLENLQALCEECNAGKKALFSSLDDDVMREVIKYPSVHHRIAKALLIKRGMPVPSKMLEIIADQEDWHKRLRELRYLGWVIEVCKRKLPSGRVTSAYVLESEGEWCDDMAQRIREIGRQRARQKPRE